METKRKVATGISMIALLALGSAARSAEKPGDVRKQITKAEEEYFALYNKLNTDRQYDMVCRKDVATGTTFAKRVCQPRYVELEQQANATQRIQSAIQAGASASAANTRGADIGAGGAGGPVTTTGASAEGFRRNMLEVLQKSPELQALGRKRDELQARLDELTKK